MLQINTTNFASDALEDAMRLAQTKALNSYTFSDCLNYLNYSWRDIYDRVACIDDGYYGINVRVTKKLTRLPRFVKNTVQVYYAQSPVGYDRVLLRESGTTDMVASGTYKISGFDLYVPDAESRNIWLYYVPECPQVFFTHHNRDPIIHDELEVSRNDVYGLFRLIGYNKFGDQVDIKTATRDDIKNVTTWKMRHRNDSLNQEEDVTELYTAAPLEDENDGEWKIVYISCDYPYVFVTYEQTITGEHLSGFFDADRQFNKYNPFAFLGRNSNVEYVHCRWNDKTGMGVVIKDYNDDEKLKELGWTPDTRLDYPAPEMYRYLVARLAQKFATLNESDIMGVQAELVEAQYAFEAFLQKDKSSFRRIANVNPATITDWL